MCLSRIDATYDKPSDLIVDGWKEFGGTPAQPKSYNFAYGIKLDQWIRAAELGPPMDIVIPGNIGPKSYKAGFHAYPDEQNKPCDAVRRVYLRKITCLGEQDGKKCVVAEEMYVPFNPEGWPPKETAPRVVVPKKKLMDRIRKGRKP